jgi:N-dimethylarginine dimethylaminohydrolase
MCPPTHLEAVPAEAGPLGAAAGAPGAAVAWPHAVSPASGAVRASESAMDQWERLRETLLRLGHQVSLIPPRSGLPGMVFAAHAATVVDGRVLGARFRSTARQPEAPAYLRWFADRGFGTRLEPVFAHEGEIDLVPAGRHLLAASGPHTESPAHPEAGGFLGLPVVPLELTDPRFTRLGSAIAVLTDRTIAYLPAAFSDTARERLARLFPERIAVREAEALVGGLDAICDGRNVVLTDRAPGLAGQLTRHGFRVMALDMSCFATYGVGVRSCVLELRDNH